MLNKVGWAKRISVEITSFIKSMRMADRHSLTKASLYAEQQKQTKTNFFFRPVVFRNCAEGQTRTLEAAREKIEKTGEAN